MLLSILDNFFSICSWWMLPLLLIAWLLGSWFWNLYQGSKLRANIGSLETEVSGLKSDIASQLVTIQGLEKDKSDLRFQVGDVETTLFAEREQMAGIVEELNELKKKFLE